MREKLNDVPALYIKAVGLSHLPDREKEYRVLLDEILLLDPNHKDARNRLIALAKNSSPHQAFQMLPPPSDSEDSETKLYRAAVLIALKRYQDALSVLSTLNGAAFDSHYEARLYRARAFRGVGDYAPAYLHVTKAVELQPSEASYMTRASIILEYWEWMRRRGLITFGDDGTNRGVSHARLVAGVPHPVIMLTESQNLRLGSSSVTSSTSADAGISPLQSSLLSNSSIARSAAVTRSRLMATKAQIVPAKLPPISDLLSIALNDLNRIIDIRPSSIQALTKRATVLHILGVYAPAIEDLKKVLNSGLLQPAERPRLILKFTRLLFDSEIYENIVEAHQMLHNQLHISLDLDVLIADVSALMVIGSIAQLQSTERLIQTALRSISERDAHAMPPISKGPLLLLMAKINKRLSELFDLNEASAEPASMTQVTIVSASQDTSTSTQKGAAEYRKCIDFATQAATFIGDSRLLVRESAFWRQSGESDLAMTFANQALIVDPNNLPAKLSKAAEHYNSGDEAAVLIALHGLSDRDAQVKLYRVLATSYDGPEEKLAAMDAYLTKLVDANSEFASARLDIRMRCWTTAQFNRALVLWRIGDRDSARETLLEVLRSSPTHPGALTHLAELLVIEGELQHATYYFEKRLSQAYTRRLRAHLLLRIASCYHLLGAYEQCLVVVNDLLRLEPNHPEALHIKADAERLNTRIGAALAYTRETFSTASRLVKKFWWSTSSTENAPQPEDKLS